MKRYQVTQAQLLNQVSQDLADWCWLEPGADYHQGEIVWLPDTHPLVGTVGSCLTEVADREPVSCDSFSDKVFYFGMTGVALAVAVLGGVVVLHGLLSSVPTNVGQSLGKRSHFYASFVDGQPACELLDLNGDNIPDICD